MHARLTVLTLAVEDVEGALRFYRDGLGFPSRGIVWTEFENGAVAFIDLEGGLKLALWPLSSLAADCGLPTAAPTAVACSLGHNVASREEVDRVMLQAKSAGGRIVKPARDTFWGGYAGYFQDLDGHLWEIVWNPDLLPNASPV